ncbi:MAG: serine hydrolase [Bacteroidota bacterium]|nr:serine hydrolase [Bacteroidota bacterium]
MKLLFALLFCIVTLPSLSQKDISISDKRLKDLDSAFARVLKEWHAAGFAVAVVEKNRVIYAKGFGYRDYENKIPITPITLFSIGSCTKAFTSALLGMLREEGKIDFDKPVRYYLPGLRFYNDNMNVRITLRDMMCHRTGLPRHDAAWYYFYTSSRDTLLQRIQYQEPTADVHEKWQYNNFMFMAQGAVTEKLTGKSWEENIREKIFQPLDMQHSTTDFNEWIHSKDVAIGYNLKHDSLVHRDNYREFAALNPAGGINSCVSDMANWVITWINGGRFGGKTIIPANYITEAISSQMVITGALPTKAKPDIFLSNYGLGWFLGAYRSHYRVMHDGLINGFTSTTCFFPSDSLVIIVRCNQTSSSVPAVVRNLIADKLLGLPYFDWQTDLKTTADKASAAANEAKKNTGIHRVLNTLPSHKLHEYEGIFSNKGYGNMQVELDHDSLFLKMGKTTIWLKHFHYDIFESFEITPGEGIDTGDDGKPHFEFQTGDDGNIESVSVQWEPALPPIIFRKVNSK